MYLTFCFERARLQGVPYRAAQKPRASAPEVYGLIRTRNSRTNIHTPPRVHTDLSEPGSAEHKSHANDNRRHHEFGDPKSPSARFLDSNRVPFWPDKRSRL